MQGSVVLPRIGPDMEEVIGASLSKSWEAYLDVARRERDRARFRDSSKFPHYTQDGRWRLLPSDALSGWTGSHYEHGNWTAGFWFGVMWLLALDGDEAAGELASSRLHALASRAQDITTHDLGFLFSPAYVLGLEVGCLTRADAGPALEAALTLGRRFNFNGEYIQAFGSIGDHRSAGTSTIDTMLNLPLLWWASSIPGREKLGEIARQHARTSARVFFRSDGSTYHMSVFDPLSGALIRRGTFQGAKDTSCWSRGQAWAVTGFAWAFAATGEPELLEAAERAASYFWAHLPSDGIPPWDFSDSAPDATLDSSAAAVAALGGLLLGRIHPIATLARAHWRRATDLLSKLASTCQNSGEEDGLLLHSCYSKPHGLGIGGATAWGDYFLGLGLGFASGHLQARTILGFEPTVSADPILPTGP
jgi:unsaturated chondroitin disaccharide hydrolase